jgi:hypothetical protein
VQVAHGKDALGLRRRPEPRMDASVSRGGQQGPPAGGGRGGVPGAASSGVSSRGIHATGEEEHRGGGSI